MVGAASDNTTEYSTYSFIIVFRFFRYRYAKMLSPMHSLLKFNCFSVGASVLEFLFVCVHVCLLLLLLLGFLLLMLLLLIDVCF